MNLNQGPLDFQILFLDMDSCFASVEQQVQPTLRGIPIGVAPYAGPTGCIIAASKEAKQQGIKTGTGVGEAKKICPKIKIIEARPALYMIYHKEINKVIKNLSPFYQALSVDEFMIYLSPSEQNFSSVRKIAFEIKKSIKEKVGDFLTCSVGVGPNRFLSKMAGEIKKPDGFYVIKLSDIEKFYDRLKDLTKITGINHQMKKHLANFNIFTLLELYQKDISELVKILNHWGRSWYFRLRGYEVDDFKSKMRNIGHSHVLAPELRSRDNTESVIKKLIFKAGYRLRKKKMKAAGVYVLVKFLNREVFSKSRCVSPFSDNLNFIKNILEILKTCHWNNKPIFVAISAFNLTHDSNNQISIFPEIEKTKKASQALDQLNDKYESEIIYPASMHQTIESAPDRIPFGKPRYDIRHF